MYWVSQNVCSGFSVTSHGCWWPNSLRIDPQITDHRLLSLSCVLVLCAWGSASVVWSLRTIVLSSLIERLHYYSFSSSCSQDIALLFGVPLLEMGVPCNVSMAGAILPCYQLPESPSLGLSHLLGHFQYLSGTTHADLPVARSTDFPFRQSSVHSTYGYCSPARQSTIPPSGFSEISNWGGVQQKDASPPNVALRYLTLLGIPAATVTQVPGWGLGGGTGFPLLLWPKGRPRGVVIIPLAWLRPDWNMQTQLSSRLRDDRKERKTVPRMGWSSLWPSPVCLWAQSPACWGGKEHTPRPLLAGPSSALSTPLLPQI